MEERNKALNCLILVGRQSFERGVFIEVRIFDLTDGVFCISACAQLFP